MALFQKNFKIYFNPIFSHLEILFLIGLRYVGKLVYIKLAIIYINMQYFGPLRSSLVHFVLVWSISVHFDSVDPFLSTLAQFGSFWYIWSIYAHSAHFGLLGLVWSILV